MIDHQNLKGPWERLKWARERYEQREGKDNSKLIAANAMGIKEGTYNAYERTPDSSKHIPLQHEQAIKFGRKLKCSWIWLLTGFGDPDDLELDDVENRVIRAIRDQPEDKREAIAEAIEGFLKITA